MKKVKNIVCIVLALVLLSGAVTMISKFGFGSGGGGGGGGNQSEEPPPTVDDLKQKYSFTYYSGLSALSSDVEAGTQTGGSKQEAADSACAAYYDSEQERTVVVLLKDIAVTESCTFNTPVELNLAGKMLVGSGYSGAVLEFNDSAYINGRLGGGVVMSGDVQTLVSMNFTAGTVVIDGGSYKVNSGASAENVRGIQVTGTVDSLTIKNAEFDVTHAGSTGSISGAIYSRCPSVIENVTVNAESMQDGVTTVVGMYLMAEANVSNCNVTCEPAGKSTAVYGIYAGGGVLTLRDNTVYTDAYNNDVSNVGENAIAVMVSSGAEKLISYGGDYTGTHCAVQLNAPAEIDGGRFVSCSHGGIYFAHTDKTSYVKNAVIGTIAYNGKFDQSVMGNPKPLGAFYIGGNAGRNNISVYMDNCTLVSTPDTYWGSGVLKGSSGEFGNCLYISRAWIPDGHVMRVDSGNCVIAGRGTDLNSENTVSGGDYRNPVSVAVGGLIQTDYIFVYGNRYAYMNASIFKAGGLYRFHDTLAAPSEEFQFTANGMPWTVGTEGMTYMNSGESVTAYSFETNVWSGSDGIPMIDFGEPQTVSQKLYGWLLGNGTFGTDEVVADSLIAYEKTVPDNVLEFAEIGQIGGMTHKTTNLLPYPYIESTKTVNGITFTDNGDGTVTVNGTASADCSFSLCSGIKVNHAVVLSGCPSGGSESTYFVMIYNGTNGYSDIGNGKQITLDHVQGKILSVSIRIRSGVTVNNLTFKPMLNEGSIALPYVSYFSGLRDAKVTELKIEGTNLLKNSFSIPEAVQALEGYGHGVNEKYYNYIKWDNDSVKFVRQTKRIVFDGTENWEIIDSSTDGVKIFALKSNYDAYVKGEHFYGIGLCSHFDFNGNGNCMIGQFSFQYGDGNCIRFFVDETKYPTVDEWKAYLASLYAGGTPVEVEYVIANSETVDISNLITADNLIGVEPLGTITAVNDYKLAVPTSVIYRFKSIFTEETDTVSGQYRLEKSGVMLDLTTEFEQAVTFTSGGSTYTAMQVVYDADGGILYYEDVTAAEYNHTEGMLSWVLDVYITVDFGTEPQEVSKQFYDWLIANAEPIA